METGEWIALGAAVVALLITAYVFWQRGKPLTFETAGELVSYAEPLSAKLDLYARSVVIGIQQLKQDDMIDTGDEAMKRALAQMEIDFPNVDTQVLIDRIELAYKLLKPLFKPKDVTPEADMLDHFLSEGDKGA